MTPSRIRFVYFDLDDTLLDHRHAEHQGLADLCSEFDALFGHLPFERVRSAYHEHNGLLWHQYALGNITRDDLKRLRFEKTLATLGINGIDAYHLNERYLACYARHWTLPDDARRAFHSIANRFPVGLLTNGFSEIQHAKLDRFPSLRERSQVVVISEEVGVMKPHQQIFTYAARAVGIPTASILYIGDSLQSDVQGALNAGWHAAWYAPSKAATEAPDGAFHFSGWDSLLVWLLRD